MKSESHRDRVPRHYCRPQWSIGFGILTVILLSSVIFVSLTGGDSDPPKSRAPYPFDSPMPRDSSRDFTVIQIHADGQILFQQRGYSDHSWWVRVPSIESALTIASTQIAQNREQRFILEGCDSAPWAMVDLVLDALHQSNAMFVQFSRLGLESTYVANSPNWLTRG